MNDDYLFCPYTDSRLGDERFYKGGPPPLPTAVSTTALSVTERNGGASSGVEQSSRNVQLEDYYLVAVGSGGGPPPGVGVAGTAKGAKTSGELFL